MHTLRSKLIALTTLAVLAVIGAVMNSRQAAAQGPPDGLAVRIVNPLPVPVNGSTTVSGTIGATQSGLWNVGITNGTATTPIFVKNVDEPGRAPYQQEVQTAAVCDASFCNANFNFAPVPAGKRLVIKTVSYLQTTFVGAAVLVTVIGGNFTQSHIPVTAATNPIVSAGCPAANPCVIWSVNQPVDIYVDAGSSPIGVATVDLNHNANFVVEMTISGYYVSLP
jgi:hypothetical protein